MFFHQPSRAPPPTPPAFTQDATPLTPSFQQSNSHWPGLNNAIGPLNPINHDSAATPGMPWHQATNTIPLTPIAPLQENRRPCAEQGEQEEEDIEMENSDYLSATTSKPVATDTSKGLAGSMWNPANRNTSANSVDGSQTLFEAGSDTTKKAPMVISGITKGPGLKASRWCG
ncbi:hypothetical protein ANO14919_087270 [Xylariales sp. No.14919]|nr:hypothetical protein ANO14919_087270 [Xylariales sp. No.14919]